MIVYVKTGCPWCDDVLDFLHENKIEFDERNVSENPEYMKEMVEKSSQSKAPTIDIDGEIFADSDKDELEKVLKEKGILTTGSE